MTDLEFRSVIKSANTLAARSCSAVGGKPKVRKMQYFSSSSIIIQFFFVLLPTQRYKNILNVITNKVINIILALIAVALLAICVLSIASGS
jgi:hypothetical protein